MSEIGIFLKEKNGEEKRKMKFSRKKASSIIAKIHDNALLSSLESPPITVARKILDRRVLVNTKLEHKK